MSIDNIVIWLFATNSKKHQSILEQTISIALDFLQEWFEENNMEVNTKTVYQSLIENSNLKHGVFVQLYPIWKNKNLSRRKRYGFSMQI